MNIIATLPYVTLTLALLSCAKPDIQRAREHSYTAKDKSDLNISNGRVIAENEWNAVVRVNNCTGNIIANNIILTADHCLRSLTKSLTIQDVHVTLSDGQVVQPIALHFNEKALQHRAGSLKYFQPEYMAVDIAILEFQQNQFENFHKQAVRTYNPFEQDDSLGVDLIGYGKHDFGESHDNKKRYGQNNIHKKDMYNSGEGIILQSYGHAFNHDGSGENSNPLPGDSGGPIIYNNQIIGVVSGGEYLNTEKDYKKNQNKVSYAALHSPYIQAFLRQHISLPQEKNIADLSLKRSSIIAFNQHNKSGTKKIWAGATEQRACFFTRVHFEDIDSGKEKAICSIDKVNGHTHLRAELQDTKDADAMCSSHCLSWDVRGFRTYDASVSREKSEGISKKDITHSKENVFCGLSRVEFQELDSSGERAECRVIEEDGQFKVTSELYKSSDLTASCQATCLEFPQEVHVEKKQEQYISRHNTQGLERTALAEGNNHFCFLKSVSFEDVDDTGEFAACNVSLVESTWVLDAHLGKTNDSDSWCSAQCISW